MGRIFSKANRRMPFSFTFSSRFALETWRNHGGIVEESWRFPGAGCAAVLPFPGFSAGLRPAFGRPPAGLRPASVPFANDLRRASGRVLRGRFLVQFSLRFLVFAWRSPRRPPRAKRETPSHSEGNRLLRFLHAKTAKRLCTEKQNAPLEATPRQSVPCGAIFRYVLFVISRFRVEAFRKTSTRKALNASV